MDTNEHQPTSPDIVDAAAATPDTAPPLWAAPVRGAWTLCWRRPRQWLLLTVPGLIYSLTILAHNSAPLVAGRYDSAWGRILAYGACLTPMLGFLAAYCSVVLTVAMAREMAGRQRGLAPLTAVVNASLVSLIGLAVLLALSISAALLVVGVVFGIINAVLPQAAGQLPTTPNLASIPFGIAGLGMVAFLILRVGFAFNSVLLSRLGIVDSVRASVRLTKAAWARLTGYMLLASAPSVVAVLLYFVPGSRPPYSTLALVTRAVVGVVAALWSIYGTALWLLAWYRLRALKDGLSLAEFAAELGGEAAVATLLHPSTNIPGDVV